ncbi:putative rhamnosyl transferase [Pseudaestuariivita atlantica]|uniref:Rhamnosyl transferase n=1 Tax=Pseudaestuariivita atlantica TaxID=1317121 RepID=A0A0L1JJT8_9RHOB|nr:putative rhamnosyl transferase [Pseudaestuariivita atlantica]KNG91977.1 hypothetical protein ATO11_19735 [Pseudaestuariivita atlantica]
MQTIGLCRFSYPAIGGFQVEHDTIEDRIAYLYAEDRLEERFRLFEHVALPCLKHQTDPDFTLIVVIGDSFPARHRARLDAMLADLPQAVVEVHPPRPNRELMKELLNKHRRDPGAPCLQFRHDDDDAVAVDFIERMKQAVDDAAPLMARERIVGIDFNRGYVAEMGSNGISATEITRAYYVAALGVHVAGGTARTIHNFAHHKLWTRMPTVTFTDTPMWVRTHNGYNDSRQKRGAREVAVEPIGPKLTRRFANRFAIDVEAVTRAFQEPDLTLASRQSV